MKPDTQTAELPVKAAPGMDVLPTPNSPGSSGAQVAEKVSQPAPPFEPASADTEGKQPTADRPTDDPQKNQLPKKQKSTTPKLAVTVALILFIGLSGLAYYAFTKAK